MARTAQATAEAHGLAAVDGLDPWRELLGAVLDRREVERLLNLGTQGELDDLVAESRLLALPAKRGELLFPAFQFGPNGSLNQTIIKVMTILRPVVVTSYTIASWLRSPKEQLGGKTPVEWLDLGNDPESVIAAAELAADHLSA